MAKKKEKEDSPVVIEIKCECGKVCGNMTYPPGTEVDLKEFKKAYQSVCDSCSKK